MTDVQRPHWSIDEFSATSSPLQMAFRDTEISFGTCFFWASEGATYLVTNWHNLTGKNPLTGKHLSSTAAEPDRVRFDVFWSQNLNDRRWIQLMLDDEAGPLWLEHPVHGRQVDVVCLPIPSEFAGHPFSINQRRLEPLQTRVPDEVFILGFPMGVGPGRLPIWKRASVASEPAINVDNLPKMLVDTASASGMSGSPVIHRATSGLMEDGSTVMSASSMMTRFVGVYSGRLTTGNTVDAQLGIVWKASVLDEIIRGARRGTR